MPVFAIERTNDGTDAMRASASAVQRTPSASAASVDAPATITAKGHFDPVEAEAPSASADAAAKAAPTCAGSGGVAGPTLTPSDDTSCVSKGFVNIAISY